MVHNFMLTTLPRTRLLTCWFATLAGITLINAASGASVATSALVVLVMGVAPTIVMVLLANEASSPIMAAIPAVAAARAGDRNGRKI